MVRVKVIEEVRTAVPQDIGKWELAFQWCRSPSQGVDKAETYNSCPV